MDVLHVQLMLMELKFPICKVESCCVPVVVVFLLPVKKSCDSNNKNNFTQMLPLNSYPFKPNPQSWWHRRYGNYISHQCRMI